VVQPGEDLHDRGLAGAVLSDERVDLTGENLQGPISEGDDRAESLGRPESDSAGTARGSGPSMLSVILE